MARLLNAAIAGLTTGLLVVVLSIGNGSLIFAGELSAFLPVAIGMSLAGAAVMSIVASFSSNIRNVAVNIQEVPVIGMAAIAATVAASVAPAANEQAVVASVIAAIVVSTLLCGFFGLFFGYMRLGFVVRFIPYPVMAGFLAGTGALVLLGGLSMVLGSPVSLALLMDWPLDAWPKVLFAAAFLLALALAGRRYDPATAFPVTIVAAVVVFSLGAAMFGTSADQLRADGWLIALPKSGSLWPPLSVADLALVDWPAVLFGLVSLPTVLVVTVVAVLLNATGLELQQRRDVDLNREIAAVGWMNLFGGAAGGLPGFQSMSATLLSDRFGGNGRVTAFIVAVCCVSILLIGDVVLDVVPVAILGALLIWIGGNLLNEWLILSARRVDRWEYLVILVIFLAIVAISFPMGIAAGLLMAFILFVVQYGQVDIVRHIMTGAQHQSGTDLYDRRNELLREHGDSILIIRLQGYLFFGTADPLRRRLREQILAGAGTTVRYLVIDFARVTGLDSSTVVSFIQLRQLAEANDFRVVLTGLQEIDRQTFLRAGLPPDDAVLHVEADTHLGIKWAEDSLLAELQPQEQTSNCPLDVVLERIVGDDGLAALIAGLCERIEADAGLEVIAQGDASDDIYFVESGRAAVQTMNEQGAAIRLATVGPGAVIGEMAYYLAAERSASVTAEEAMVLWRCPRDRLAALESTDPEAVLAFHRGMAAMLSARLTQTNQLVRFLAD